jgi:hypothetical protein
MHTLLLESEFLTSWQEYHNPLWISLPEEIL